MKKYKELFNTMSAFLKNKGYTKKGDTFYFHQYDNWGIIDFQRGRKSIGDSVVFTINLGICSSIIRKLISEIGMNVKPSIEDCHWCKRVGLVMPQKNDYWWQIDNSTIVVDLSDEIVTLFETVILAEIESNIQNVNLEAKWLNGISDGVTEMQRYIYLTTLLKVNQRDNYDAVVEEFLRFATGKTFEYSARDHIKELSNMHMRN